ncbi:hypothetical protein ROHU_003725 [Labeo rohita]|uniref:Uncharacterized protein n=1 Tax=Labeo rohita TaxID=84645 RepID=A0A498NVT1_LABRO|nr:hypothetical protein ROHU_003725 [Labeo rohita]
MYSPDKYQPRGGTPLSPPETGGIAPFRVRAEPRKEQPEVSPLIKHLYPQGKACPVPATRANSGLAEGGPFEDGLNQTAAFYVLENMTSRHILISSLDSFIIHTGADHKRA